MSDVQIECRDLTKMYGDLFALNRLNMTLHRGDVYAVGIRRCWRRKVMLACVSSAHATGVRCAVSKTNQPS